MVATSSPDARETVKLCWGDAEFEAPGELCGSYCLLVLCDRYRAEVC